MREHTLCDNAVGSGEREVYAAAKTYLRSALSLIPIRADGTKMPAIELLPRVWDESTCHYRRPWGGYRERQPTLAELRKWFKYNHTPSGLAILAGEVSGNLEILDLDNWGVVKPWMKLVHKRAPLLLHKLVLVKTPRPGLHVYYRCSEIEGNQKLARVPDPDKDHKQPKTIIEVKGEGGYCLAPPSPAACHPSGRCYTVISKRHLTEIPTLARNERQVLHDCARRLNCWQASRPHRHHRHHRQPGVQNHLLRPGDDFNARADWANILEPHDWRYAGTGADRTDRWCRPGKTLGTSATTNLGDLDLLYIFSSNAAPFEEERCYNKFQAYTLLEHDGDYHAAAKALFRQGYGGGSHRERQAPFERYAEYAVRLGQKRS